MPIRHCIITPYAIDWNDDGDSGDAGRQHDGQQRQRRISGNATIKQCRGNTEGGG